MRAGVVEGPAEGVGARLGPLREPFRAAGQQPQQRRPRPQRAVDGDPQPARFRGRPSAFSRGSSDTAIAARVAVRRKGAGYHAAKIRRVAAATLRLAGS